MAASGIKGGYWPTWTADRFPPRDIPDYFTHNFYAFINIDPNNFELSVADHDDALMRDFTANLHSRNTPQKAFISIGGWSGSSESSNPYSRMARDPNNRAAFINSTIHVARTYNFDGLDLDWEYPKGQEDMTNLSALFREWYRAVEQESDRSGRPRLLLSAAVYHKPVIDCYDAPLPRYPVDAINGCLDFVCVMCYDYYGSWDITRTGAHALLYDRREWAPSTDRGISSWIEAGVLPKKLVMGLPLYGRSWRLKSTNDNRIGAPAVAVGPGEDGYMSYNEIVRFNRERGANVSYDDQTVSVYSYAGTDWIGYDGPESTARKVRFAKDRGLGGFFFWALGFDDAWVLPQTALRAWQQ